MLIIISWLLAFFFLSIFLQLWKILNNFEKTNLNIGAHEHSALHIIMNPGASYIDRDLDNNPMLLIRNNVVDNLIRNQFIEIFKKSNNRKR